MRPVVDQPSDVVSGHLGKLLLKDILQTRQDNRALSRIIIIHYAELDIAVALFNNRICWWAIKLVNTVAPCGAAKRTFAEECFVLFGSRGAVCRL